MVLANGVQIIWLDAFIGEDGKYHTFKRNFQTALEPVMSMPPDALNILICSLEENAVPILFAHTPAQAASFIEQHHDKQIIFISSGSMGKYMVPFITAFYPHVHRFYFFCGFIGNYTEFGLEYISCLQMFDHETDLLVRLARDISNDIIKQGKIYLDLHDGQCALKCFEHALTLNLSANQIDKGNSPLMTHIRELNGRENEVGLIQRAHNMLKEQQQQQ